MSHWIYKNSKVDEIPEGAKGFVYEITNNVTHKKYIGKKFFYSTRTLKPLKGKVRNRKVTKESDWRDYTSSSDIVNSDISNYGKDKFVFEILIYCPDKAQTNYSELVIHVKRNVLEAVDNTGERIYLNKNIYQRYYQSDKHKDFRLLLEDI